MCIKSNEDGYFILIEYLLLAVSITGKLNWLLIKAVYGYEPLYIVGMVSGICKAEFSEFLDISSKSYRNLFLISP